MTRDEILTKATECVCGDRENFYGSPEDSFDIIAKLWTAYLSSIASPLFFSVNSRDVANMMILLKIAREVSGSGKDDNWVDIAGYAACGGEIAADERADSN